MCSWEEGDHISIGRGVEINAGTPKGTSQSASKRGNVNFKRRDGRSED